MSMTATIPTNHNLATYREAAAARIQQLMHDWTANTLALGAELAEAAKTFPEHPRHPGQRPGFIRWAKQASGLSPSQIFNLIKVHQKFGGDRDLRPRLGQQVMVILARDNVPNSARYEALKRADAGEHIGLPEAKKIVRVHKLPSAKEANSQARDEGRPVLARDGFIYFGTDPAKAKQGEDRRKMVFDVRDALNSLGNIHLTARQFLDYAFPHQLWSEAEAPIIKKALRWLKDLDDAWDSRQ